jgi:hypothetical protein
MQHFQVATVVGTDSSFAMASPCNDWRASFEKDWQDYRDWRFLHKKSHNAESLLNWYMEEMSHLRRKPIMSSSTLKSIELFVRAITLWTCLNTTMSRRKRESVGGQKQLENYSQN